MAKLERNLTGDFDALLEHLHRGLLRENASISCEDGSDYCSADGLRCAVRVYERYSMIGGNRVSLNLTLVGEGHFSLCDHFRRQSGCGFQDQYPGRGCVSGLCGEAAG